MNLTLNSDTWVKVNPSVSPPKRGYHEMVYDQESDVVILIDGAAYVGYGGRIGDQWVYSVSSNNWTKMNPSERPPAMGVMRGGLAYDSKHDVVIRFGGGGGGQKWKETWVYDYNTNT